MARNIYQHIWCLLCEQSPASGILRRMMRGKRLVPLGEGEATPHVCADCGNKHHDERGKPHEGEPTRWRFMQPEDSSA